LQRHAEYYAQLAEEAERVGPGGSSREAQLEWETSNGRAALQWTYAQGKVELGLRLVTSFAIFWFRHGRIAESGLWLERMLELDAAAEAAEAAEGKEVQPVVRGRALHIAARHAMTHGMYDRAETLAKKALALAEQTGDQVDRSRALAALGLIALEGGKPTEADTYFTESYEAAKRTGDAHATGLALLNLGEMARKRGDFQRAAQFLEECLALMRAKDMTWAVADTITLLGRLARQQGDYKQAKLRYRESLELYRTLDTTHTAWCLEGVAALLSDEQLYAHAIRLCAAAATLRADAHTPLPQTEQKDFDIVVRTARRGLGKRVFGQEWETGSNTVKDEAISYALHILATTPTPSGMGQAHYGAE